MLRLDQLAAFVGCPGDSIIVRLSRRYLVVLLLLVLLPGCREQLVSIRGALDHGSDGGGPTADAGDDSGAPYASWGAYAAGLPVEPCVGELMLVVSDTTNARGGGATITESAQAGATLSLPEALTIANNRSDRVAIHFDPDLFPTEAPAVISLGATCNLPALSNACVDGRNRGVVVDFGGAQSLGAGCQWQLEDGALAVGLELRNVEFAIRVGQNAQLAGCRVRPGPNASIFNDEPQCLEARTRAVIGPGNSLVGSVGLFLRVQGEAAVIGNSFGFDPVSGQRFTTKVGCYIGHVLTDADRLFGTLRIEDNVFRAMTGIFAGQGDIEDHSISIVGNLFAPGIDESSYGIHHSTYQRAPTTIGPDNTFSGLGSAILVVGGTSTPTVTRNSITNCETAIEASPLTVPPPVIGVVSAERVSGTCESTGVVEVFGDADKNAAHFVGSAPCLQGSWELPLSAPIAQPKVTATLSTVIGTSPFAAHVGG